MVTPTSPSTPELELVLLPDQRQGHLRGGALLDGIVVACNVGSKHNGTVLETLRVRLSGELRVAVHTGPQGDRTSKSLARIVPLVHLATGNLLSRWTTIVPGHDLKRHFSFVLPLNLPPSFEYGLRREVRVIYKLIAEASTDQKGAEIISRQKQLRVDAWDCKVPRMQAITCHGMDKPRWQWSQGCGPYKLELRAPDRMHLGRITKLAAILHLPEFGNDRRGRSKLSLSASLKLHARVESDHHLAKCNFTLGRAHLRGRGPINAAMAAALEEEEAEWANVNTDDNTGPTSPRDISTTSSVMLLWRFDLLLPAEDRLYTLQLGPLKQAAVITLKAKYGRREVARLRHEVIMPGHFDAGAAAHSGAYWPPAESPSPPPPPGPQAYFPPWGDPFPGPEAGMPEDEEESELERSELENTQRIELLAPEGGVKRDKDGNDVSAWVEDPEGVSLGTKVCVRCMGLSCGAGRLGIRYGRASREQPETSTPDELEPSRAPAG